MTRRIAMMSVLGLLAAGFGCRHVGGKCDCQSHPADGAAAGPTAPYPSAMAPGATTVPIPRSTSGGKLPDTMPPVTMLPK